MNVRMRQQIEKTIVLEALHAAMEAGYQVSVDNGEEDSGILADKADLPEAIMQTDMDTVYIYQGAPKHSVGYLQFVYGNDGYDVLSDYSTNLEDTPIIKRAEELASKIESGEYHLAFYVPDSVEDCRVSVDGIETAERVIVRKGDALDVIRTFSFDPRSSLQRERARRDANKFAEGFRAALTHCRLVKE